jgi:hypothetical protein
VDALLMDSIDDSFGLLHFLKLIKQTKGAESLEILALG